VRSDLPRLAAEIRAAHPAVDVSVVPTIGEADSVIDAIAGYCLDPSR
jgi:sirohydrochlorin cobaltochelatase